MFVSIFIGITIQSCHSQPTSKPEKEISTYEFKDAKEVAHTPISYQDMTGTCWAFAMTSFIESEIIRKTEQKIDLSEMYIVRNAYLQKAYSNIMRHGQYPIIEGGLNPDALEAIAINGLMPYKDYTGLKDKEKFYDHEKMFKQLKEVLPKYAKSGIQNKDWKIKINTILDKGLGETPNTFNYNGENFTPEDFLNFTTINTADYLHITSFNHKPYYKNMILDIEWNISNKSFYNVPVNDFCKIANEALDNGFTIAVELDVSEKGYSGEYGIAVIPNKEEDFSKILYTPLIEKEITQELRQLEFENFKTNNDHNQHIIGKIKDQNGKNYFIAKNSWRDWGKNGYIYISEAYFKQKVIYFTIHKEALDNKYKLDCP